MGGFSPMNVGNPGGGTGGQAAANPILMLLSAIGGLHTRNQDDKKTAAELAQSKATTDATTLKTKQEGQLFPLQLQNQQATLDATNRTTAQQQWDFGSQYLAAHPEAGADETIKQRMVDAAATLGLPAPLKQNADGTTTLDTNAFLKSSQSFDEKTREYVFSLKGGGPDSPRGIAAASHGVRLTPEELSVEQAFNPKDLASLQRAATYGIRVTDQKSIADTRLKIQRELADATKNLDSAKITNMQAATTLAQQKYTLAVTKLNEVDIPKAQAAVMRAMKAGPTSPSAKLGQSLLLEASKSVHVLEQHVAEADAAYGEAYARNVDSDVLDALSEKAKAAHAGLTQAQIQLQDAGTMINGNTGSAAAVKNQTGASRVTVTTIGAKPPFAVPAGYTAKQQGGKWGVVDAAGTFYPKQ